jgi:hypothetical protein
LFEHGPYWRVEGNLRAWFEDAMPKHPLTDLALGFGDVLPEEAVVMKRLQNVPNAIAVEVPGSSRQPVA